jgi:NMD protein affecting ribosome stability and mRNA decay
MTMFPCDECGESFYADDLFMGMCDTCYRKMLGVQNDVEPIKRKGKFDDD